MQSTIITKSEPGISSGLRYNSWFLPAEKTMITVALAAGVVDLVLIWYKNSLVDWAGYLTILALVAGLLTLGLFYRVSGRSERIGAAGISAGLFIFFSLCLSMFNYLLLPLWREPIDLGLNAIDQLFGYSWPAVIEWAGQNPVFNSIVRFAYLSTIPQIAAIIVILGLTGKIKELNTLIVAVTITATFTITFWGLFPSLGAKSLYDLPLAMELLASPVVSTAYGDQMLLMAKEGPGLISPKEIKGLVAFPSYHIVLSGLAVYAARTVKWIFPFYLVLNALILPGIYMHGGHHLVDLPAGLLVAAVGLYLARKAVKEHYLKYKLPEILEK